MSMHASCASAHAKEHVDTCLATPMSRRPATLKHVNTCPTCWPITTVYLTWISATSDCSASGCCITRIWNGFRPCWGNEWIPATIKVSSYEHYTTLDSSCIVGKLLIPASYIDKLHLGGMENRLFRWYRCEYWLFSCIQSTYTNRYTLVLPPTWAYCSNTTHLPLPARLDLNPIAHQYRHQKPRKRK